MRVETSDQDEHLSTLFMMKNKCYGAELQFLGCRRPTDTSKWPDYQKNVLVEVINDKYTKDIKAYAQFTVKWFLGKMFKNVKCIRLHGYWYVKGAGIDLIDNVDYDLTSRTMLKLTVNHSENNYVNVAANADAIVITGAENVENIKVYNVAGVEVESTHTMGEVVNIKLTKNQINF